MNSEIKIILSLIVKIVATIIAVGTILGTVLLGSSLLTFLNIPSLLIVIILTGCGVVFSFGLTSSFKAFLNAFVIYKPLDNDELHIYEKLFNHASYLSFASGLIGSMISFLQIFLNSKTWNLLDPRTFVALLPFFYGIILSVLIIQSLKFSMINNQLKAIKDKLS